MSQTFDFLVEPLEGRRLLSVAPSIAAASPAITLGPTPISVPMGQGVTLHEQQGVSFTASVGTFVTIAPGTNLHARIRWGDGTASKGVIKADGVIGVDQINFEVDGTHKYLKSGTFKINVVVTQSGTVTPVRLIATIKSTAIVTAGRNVALGGTITGRYSLAPTAADIGAVYLFTGAGTAGDLGDVSARGSVSLPGFILSGNANGTLTLTSTGPSASAVLDSVTLTLRGPTEPGFGPFPSTLTYVVTGGTGRLTGATGTGTIAVTLGSGMSFTFVMSSNPPP